MIMGCNAKVVVLNENGVGKAGAMIASPATTDGIFFQASPTGRRLARIVNASLGFFDTADIFACERSDSRETAEKVQQRPLAGEHVVRGTSKVGEASTGDDYIAIGGAWLPIDCGVHFVEEDWHGPQAGQNSGLANDDRRTATRFGVDEGDGRPIVLAAEVFAHGEPNELTEVIFDRGVPVELVEVSGQWA